MPNIGEMPRKKDLATRAFGNFYFGLAWILLLAIVVSVVWPLRDVLLVIWVYGRDGYFKEGIRVIKEKPVMFSNGAAAPELADIATGFGVFLVTVFGLSILMVYALRLVERLFGNKADASDR